MQLKHFKILSRHKCIENTLLQVILTVLYGDDNEISSELIIGKSFLQT